jgi:hypothetical protein
MTAMTTRSSIRVNPRAFLCGDRNLWASFPLDPVARREHSPSSSQTYLLDNSRQPLRPMPGGAQIEARGSLLNPLG